MKKVILLIMFIICISQSSSAQTIGKAYVGMNFGASSFTSGGTDSPTDVHIGLESSYRLNYNYTIIATGALTWDANSTFWEVTGNGRYYFQPESEFKFFGEAGLGIYTARVEFLGIVLASKTYAGINLGGGVSKSFLADKLIMNLKVKYHNPFASGDSKVNWFNTTLGVSVQM